MYLCIHNQKSAGSLTSCPSAAASVMHGVAHTMKRPLYAASLQFSTRHSGVLAAAAGGLSSGSSAHPRAAVYLRPLVELACSTTPH